MVWFYVAVGLVVIIAIILLIRRESGPLKARAKNPDVVRNVTYVCMNCGYSFRGLRCPKCGSDKKPLELGQ